MSRTIGVNIIQNRTEVNIWAPYANSFHIVFSGKKIFLEKKEYGFWSCTSNEIKEHDHYKFLIDDSKELPDPTSLSQPFGVHGPSEIIDLTKFEWTDDPWKNHPLKDYFIYELHIGTFTTEGTFEGVIKKIDHLSDLGINAIEIMPVAQFPGVRNWGYDGAYPFAVQNSYGGARGLQKLVNECHKNGIAVILDVVYNHLGPEGNYFNEYGPVITQKYKTPWGGAINFDDAWCDGVRQFYFENMLMWFRDFHIDALRLDAVHAITDHGPKHFLREAKEHVEALSGSLNKIFYMIAEVDLNDTKYIDHIDQNGFGMDAQWIDEFHHALRVTAGEKPNGYYSDFHGIDHLAKAYRDAYVYDGQFSHHRKKKFGTPTRNPGHQFVVFSQNHDQVGNRMLGERTSHLVSFEMMKLLFASTIVSPFLPMLFMGEEWGETNPFQYFVDHSDPDLCRAVKEGRKKEFEYFHKGESPDPLDEETFLESRLQWELRGIEPHKTLLNYYKTLIQLRKKNEILREPDRTKLTVEEFISKNTLVLTRWNGNNRISCILNFSNAKQEVEINSHDCLKKIFDSASATWSGPADAPETIAGKYLLVQPESILIYDHQKTKK